MKKRIFNIETPVLGGFKLTHRCNLKCYHCPFWERSGKELNFDEVKGILDEMHNMGVRIMILEGGEPFLWRDGDKSLLDVVNYAKNKFFSVGITTNGSFPMKNIPSDVLWVSFDGMRETYKRIRGDFFDRVVKNIEESDHKNLYANITINQINEPELEDVIKFLSERVRGITIQFHYPYGGEEDKELFIPLNKRVSIIDRLIKLKKEGYPVLDTYRALNHMKANTWKCNDWLIANANPDGTISRGCYIKNRGEINCQHCGFAAHAEISLGFDLDFSAINMGRKIFKYRVI